MHSGKAFTLAEVLITLGIIGIVAAMTLPAAINKTKNKELEVAFKKSYSLLNQVTQRVIIEDFEGVVDANSSYIIAKNFLKYYKNAELCSTKSGNGCPDITNKTMCAFMEENYKTYNGNSKAFCVGNDAVTNTIDNTTIYFDSATPQEVGNYGKMLIAIDVNSWQKKPNKWGHDMFMFQIDSSGKLLPMGADGTSYLEKYFCSKTSTNRSNGYGCTVRAVSEPDYFKKLK